MTYRPRAESARILEVAWQHVESVPYRVSLRWLFYRLLQEGIYRGKDDYTYTFKGLLTRARKEFYNGWGPDTLADETRAAVKRGFGYVDDLGWLQSLCSHGCILDKWESQPCYVELWFEARAMTEQFTYYTDYITLRPFGGDPSLDFKWQAAKHLEAVAKAYPGKRLVVLYFGDLDDKGLQIPKSAAGDIQSWCEVPFELVRCGINPGQEKQFNIPQQFDKPGAYQWESLTDQDAQHLIKSSVSQFVDLPAMTEVETQEHDIDRRFRADMQSVIANWAAT